MEITFETEETVVLREDSKVCVEHCRDFAGSVLMATTKRGVSFGPDRAARRYPNHWNSSFHQ